MKLNIHNLCWEVEFVRDKESFEDSEHEALCGLTKKLQLKISINSQMSDDLVHRTIIHELTHAYVWSYGFENIESFKEEDLCNFVETFSRNILSDADKIFIEYKKEEKKFKSTINQIQKSINKLNKEK